MCMLIVWYPTEFSRLHNLHPWNCYSLLYSFISGRIQRTNKIRLNQFNTFSAAIAIHNSPIFVPPSTHHCRVDRGSIWEACPTPLHMVGSVTRALVTHTVMAGFQQFQTLTWMILCHYFIFIWIQLFSCKLTVPQVHMVECLHWCSFNNVVGRDKTVDLVMLHDSGSVLFRSVSFRPVVLADYSALSSSLYVFVCWLLSILGLNIFYSLTKGIGCGLKCNNSPLQGLSILIAVYMLPPFPLKAAYTFSTHVLYGIAVYGPFWGTQYGIGLQTHIP